MKNLKKIIPIMTLLLLANNAIAKTTIIYQRSRFGHSYNEWGYYNNHSEKYSRRYYPYYYNYPFEKENYKFEKTKFGYGMSSGLKLDNEFLLIQKDDTDLKEQKELKTRVDKIDAQATYTDKKLTKLQEEVDKNKVSIKSNKDKIDKQQEELNNINKIVKENKLEQEQTNEKLSAGIATSIAMASIPQVSEGRLFSIGFGGAYYNKQGGFAIGISGTENSRRVVYKVTAGINTKKEFAAGAGFNINFGTTTSRAMVSPSINVEDQSESKNKIKELQEQINELKKIVEELKRKVK